MKIEILSIGNEVLSGKTINTNASYISNELIKVGYQVSQHSVISDDIHTIVDSLTEIFQRSSLVICTGGLGPTIDDLTKKAASSFFNLPLEFHEEIYEDLKKRYPDHPVLVDQASVLKGAHIVKNTQGSASGMIVVFKKGCAVFLPGVPFEMQSMFDQVLTFLKKNYPLDTRPFIKELSICLIEEIELDNFIVPFAQKESDVKIGIYPYLGGVHLVLSVNDEKNKEKVERIAKEVKKKYRDKIYDTDRKIELAIYNAFIERGLTLALAESCTGGAISARLTEIAGSSKYLLGSIVTYSNDLKHSILKVSEHTLEKDGAVSKETVRQMIEGIFKITQADYAVAVSGIAGPSGGAKEKPVGTVYVGVGQRGKPPEIGRIFGRGGRLAIVEYTVNCALGILYRNIVYQAKTF